MKISSDPVKEQNTLSHMQDNAIRLPSNNRKKKMKLKSRPA